MPFKFPREHKDRVIENMQGFFHDERKEKIGRLSAEQILDFVLGEAAPVIYNQALKDARQVVNQKAVDMEDELYALEKSDPLISRGVYREHDKTK